MTRSRIERLRDVLEEGVGTPVVVELDTTGARTGLRSYFSGLTQHQGPVCSIVPSGLKRHVVRVRFGKFASECIAQMQSASEERRLVARALIQNVAATNQVSIAPSQSLEDWTIDGPNFSVEVLIRNVEDPATEESLSLTAKAVMVPLMACMAELIGYDEVQRDEGEIEGNEVERVIRRRERSPRNRLLCFSIHGYRCAACGFVPSDAYQGVFNILEVHHLEPLGMLEAARIYDPRADLVPLCPNCHRAIHVRRPIPYSLAELRSLLVRGHA